MKDYFAMKNTIPTDQLIEIRFEEFEQDPFPVLKDVYEKFGMDNWNEASKKMETYYMDLDGYKKNVYKIKRSELERVKKEWDFAFKELGYDLPENLEVIED